MHNFLVCAYNSQYFVQTPEYFAWSHDRETVTFRISAYIKSLLKEKKNVLLFALNVSYCILFTLNNGCLKVHGGEPIILCNFIDPL